jgi:hypothetical protein
MRDNLSKWSGWLGYIVNILVFGQSFFLLLLVNNSPMKAERDLIMLVICSISYLLSPFIAYKWPFVSGVLLVSVGLGLGVSNAILNIWVGIYYGFLPFVAGIAFLIKGICSSIEHYQHSIINS